MLRCTNHGLWRVPCCSPRSCYTVPCLSRHLQLPCLARQRARCVLNAGIRNSRLAVPADTPANNVADPNLYVKPAISKESFQLQCSDLIKMVEEGFENSGRMRYDAFSLAARLCTSVSRGVVVGDGGLDAAARMAAFGINRLPPPKTTSFWDLVVEAMQDTTILLLMGAGGISLGLAWVNPEADSADWIEGFAILVSVLIVVSVASVTNYHKEAKFRVLNAIKDDIQVRVVRDGLERSVSTYDLMVGDIVIVETGDIIAADGVLVDGEDLRVDESHMTGESEEVLKSPEGSTLMLSGSKVLEGYGRMLVVAVGPNSQQGRLSALVAGQEVANGAPTAKLPTAPEAGGEEDDAKGINEDTFLMRKLDVLATQIGNFGITAAAGVLAINCLGYTFHALQDGGFGEGGLLPHLQQYLDFFITSITILVVAVPEGLPLAVTLALAFSVQRMLADNNLVRHLNSCETMACATTICSDKTGTLTQNNMSVVRLWAGGTMYKVRPTKKGRTITLHPDMLSDDSCSCKPNLKVPASEKQGEGAQPGNLINRLLQTSAVARARAKVVAALPPPVRSFLGRFGNAGIGDGSADGLPITSEPAASDMADAGPPWIGAMSLSMDEDVDAAHSHASSHKHTTAASSANALARNSPSSATLSKAGTSTHSNNGTAAEPVTGSASVAPLSDTKQDGHPLKQERPHLKLPSNLQALLLHSIVLNATASIKHNSDTGLLEKAGNRTECALLEFAMRLGDHEEDVGSIKQSAEVLQLIPFTSQRKRMSVLIRKPDSDRGQQRAGHPVPVRLMTKGAAELVLEHCSFQLTSHGTIAPLSAARKTQMMTRFGQNGLRMLALAYRDLSLPSHAVRLATPYTVESRGGKGQQQQLLRIPADQLEKDLVLVALVGLEDPLREDVHQSIQQCQRAGITVRMLTGDNARTAVSIARQCGILPPDSDIDSVLQTCSLLQRPHPDAVAAGVAQVSGSSYNTRRKSDPPNMYSTDVDTPEVSRARRNYHAASSGRLSRIGSEDIIDVSTEDAHSSLYEPSHDVGSVTALQHTSPHACFPHEVGSASWRNQRLLEGSDGDDTEVWEYQTARMLGRQLQQQYAQRTRLLAQQQQQQKLQQQQQQQQQQQEAKVAVVGVAAGTSQQGAASHAALGSRDSVSAAKPSDSSAMPVLRSCWEEVGASLGSLSEDETHMYRAVNSRDELDAFKSAKHIRPTVASAFSSTSMASISATMPSMTSASDLASVHMSNSSSSFDVPPKPDAAAAAEWKLPEGLPETGLVLEGPQFRSLVTAPDGTLDLATFRALWPKLRVMARCSPTDKFLLVSALKQLRQQSKAVAAAMGDDAATVARVLRNMERENGAAIASTGSGSDDPPPDRVYDLEPLVEVVAMTGDGTNDAPALSAADVGFAMNSGTSIAKDAADILLMDDSFSSIVSAVKWGRNVYASVTKFLQFQLTANVVAVATACAGAVALQVSPLSAVQMLWVNLIMDSLASLALATESPSDAMLDLPPCSVEQPLVNHTVAKHILGQAVFQLITLYVLVFHGQEMLGVDDDTCHTIVFNTFVFMQLFNQLNCRKILDEADVFEGLDHHLLFCGILGAEVVLQVLIVQYGGRAFQTTPLGADHWALCLGLGSLTLGVRAALRTVDAKQLFAGTPLDKALGKP